MIATRGLTHVALKVADLDRTIAFYASLIDARVLIRNERVAELGTPGAHDVITLELSSGGEVGGLGTHIGFRLLEPTPVETLVAAVEEAGGTVAESGEFAPGQPYVFARDPDGYQVELWFEPVSAARPE